MFRTLRSRLAAVGLIAAVVAVVVTAVSVQQLTERDLRSSLDRDLDLELEIRDELVDRYGPVPEIVDRLIAMMRIRMRMKALLVEGLTYDHKTMVFTFHRETPVGPEQVLALIQSEPTKYAMSKDTKLVVRAPGLSFHDVIREVRTLLERLGPQASVENEATF